jgi:hypothetical protein
MLQGTCQEADLPKLSDYVRAAVAKHVQKVEEEGQLVIFLSSPFNGLRDERDLFINRFVPLSLMVTPGVLVLSRISRTCGAVSTNPCCSQTSDWAGISQCCEVDARQMGLP